MSSQPGRVTLGSAEIGVETACFLTLARLRLTETVEGQKGADNPEVKSWVDSL